MKHEKGVKRFGARYGLRVRKRLGKIEALKKSQKDCPYCGYSAVKWQAVGIWYCKKCGKKFTGQAFTISAEPETQPEEGENGEV